jgi:hypothetical protein
VFSVRQLVHLFFSLFQLYFYGIQYRGHAIEGDLNAIPFNFASSTIPEWPTFKLTGWMQSLNQLTREHEILYAEMLQRKDGF